jgi:hypothetical protein
MMNTDSIDFSAEIGVLSSLAHTERDLAQGVTRWILSNFRSDVATAVQHTPFTPALLCAIACREAGAFWLPLTPNRPAAEILGLCVYDASGDVPGAPRTAFPVNTSAFRLAYGEDFTNLLIQETNKARAARGLSEAAMVYKGYGIFQYDLQHVRTDEAFFRARQWHSFAECVSRAVAELKKKYDVTHDIQDAVRAYNGSGPRAEQYARDVMRILPYCEEAAGGFQGAPPLMTAQIRHRELDAALSQLPAAVAPSEDDPAAPRARRPISLPPSPLPIPVRATSSTTRISSVRCARWRRPRARACHWTSPRRRHFFPPA